MKTGLEALLAAALLIATPCPSVAAAFNLRASLEHGYYVSGTVQIDTVTGVATGVSSTLYRDGVSLSGFGGTSGQGPFAPGGGIAPSYLVPSTGTNGYLFVGAIPGTTLVGYGGGALCSITSAVRCAYSDVFQGSTDIANAIQGALLPASDTIETFALTGTFDNGDTVSGTVVIDTTAGFVLDEHATLFSHGVVIDEFFNPLVQDIFAPGGGVSSSYLFGSKGPGGVLLNLGVPGTSLVGYAGGNLCATGNGLTCAFSDIFPTSTLSYNAVTASLVRLSSVPEPSSLALIGLGLVAAGLAWRRRSSARSTWTKTMPNAGLA